MTMKPLHRFWSLLDELPGATTDRLEWRTRLGPDWLVASRFLKPTGRRATALGCPSPGGDGCPRRVVKRPDGTYLAVCGQHPAECDDVQMSGDDIAHLALDQAKLARAVLKLLNATPEGQERIDSIATLIGRHGVVAGASIPICMLVPGPRKTDLHSIRERLESEAPAVIVIPTADSISSLARSRLTRDGHLILALADIVAADEAGRLEAIEDGETILAALRERVIERLASHANPGRAWLLPDASSWEDLSLSLTSDEELHVSYGGVTRRFEPADLGMRSRKNGKPTLAWTVLRTMVVMGGVFTCANPSRRSAAFKQKQELSKELKNAFGISGEPIPWDKAIGGYRARFLIRDDRPRGRRGVTTNEISSAE